MKYIIPQCLTVLVLLGSPALGQTTWFVDITGTPPGTGTPADPYTSIQYAISAASTVNGDTVQVAPGNYAEMIDYLGKAIAIISTVGASGTTITASSTGTVVSFVNGETASSILRGFRITEGEGTMLPSTAYAGGGIFCQGSSPLIEDCVIVNNGSTVDYGAGIYCTAASPRLVRTEVSANGFIFYRGGGLYCDAGSQPVIEQCSFVGNTGDGGGIWAGQSMLQVTDTLIDFNPAYTEGGGIRAEESQVFLTRCTVSRNTTAEGLGGGLAAYDCDTELTDCIFLSNLVDNDHRGGGMMLEDGTLTALRCEFEDNFSAHGGGAALIEVTATFSDCVFRGNTSQAFMAWDGSGGGLHVSGGVAALERCSFVHNVAIRGFGPGGEGGGSYGLILADHCTWFGNEANTAGAGHCGGGIFDSCIFWENRLDTGLLANVCSAGATIDYSDVQAGFPGTGNIDADPLFWSVYTGDVHLMVGSPCINTGNPAHPTDPDGSRADMGAYSYDAAYITPPFTYCSGKTNSLGCIPFLTVAGNPSTSDTTPFRIAGEDLVPNVTSFHIYGSRKAQLGFHGGTLCVKSPFRRWYPAKLTQNTGSLPCTGRTARNFNMRIQNGSDPALTAGRTVTLQLWYRDVADPTGFGDGLTDAVKFTIAP